MKIIFYGTRDYDHLYFEMCIRDRPKIAVTALINIKFQFNTLLRFKVIKPIRHPS